MKPSKNTDELCYPFIYETSYLCDFEAITDELCSTLGYIHTVAGEAHADIQSDMEILQPLCWHLNGSIRGQLAISKDDMSWLLSRINHYRDGLEGSDRGFFLPRGPEPVPQLNMARSGTKKAIRAMVRVEQEGKEVPEILGYFTNAMCNLFFFMTLMVNQRTNTPYVAFESKSYCQAGK